MEILRNGRKVGNGSIAVYFDNKVCFTRRGLNKRTVLHELCHHLVCVSGARATNNSLVQNRMANSYIGMGFGHSQNNTFRNNTMTNNTYGFGTVGYGLGLGPSQFMNDIDESNTVDGKPVIFLFNKQNMTINPETFPSIGFLGIVNSTDITIEDIDMRNNNDGILLAYTNSSSVRNVTITKNALGILLVGSSDNIITENEILENLDGLGFSGGINNSITRNKIANNRNGIWVSLNSNTRVSENQVTNNSRSGIWLFVSSNNSVVGNNITANKLGLSLTVFSSNNKILHNIFVGNEVHAESKNSSNFWEDGYPSGGNYWSDYVGADLNGDGIGDSPYTMDVNNTDGYPLMGPFSSSSATSEFDVSTISNSTVSPVVFDYLKGALSLNVTGSTGTKGFCRLEIPRILMHGPYVVMIDGTLVDSTELSASNSTHAFLYFTYTHSLHNVTVEPLIQYEYQDLYAKYSQLLTTYADLSSSYDNLLDAYGFLNQSYSVTNASIQQHLVAYGSLLANFTSYLNSFNSLQSNYTALNQAFGNLQADYDSLNSSYINLNSTLTDYKQSTDNQIDLTRNFVYLFSATTVIFAVIMIYLVVRRTKLRQET